FKQTSNMENEAYLAEEEFGEKSNQNQRIDVEEEQKEISNTPKGCKEDEDTAFSNPSNTENSDSQSEPLKQVDVDEFLIHIGQFGRAQKLLLLMFYLLEVPHSYHTLSWFFTGHSPPWRCSLTNNLTRAQCNSTAVYDIGDPFYEQRCFMERDAWNYTLPRSYSIVTEWDLVCDKKEYPFLANSLMWIGWAAGAFVLGFVSDKYGRKKVLMISFSGMITFAFTCAFLHQFWIYALMAFLIGFCQGGIALTIYVMASEFVGPKYKSLASGALTGLTYTLSLCLLSFQSWLMPEWRKLLVVTSFPYLILLFSFGLMPESIRWLRLNLKSQECEDVLRSICQFNGRKWPDIVLRPPLKTEDRNGSLFSLFTHSRLATNTLVQGFVWFVIGQVYFGISLASDQLGGNIYRDFVLTSLVGIPGNILVIVLTNKYGRKPTLIGSMAVGSFSCIGVSLINPLSELIWLRVTFGMIGQLCLALAFSSMYSWSLELMPTIIRSQAIGLLGVLIRFGGSSAPWVSQWLEHFHYTLPFAVMGSLALVASGLCVRLPETLNVPTIETIDDAKRHLKGEEFAKPLTNNIISNA
uniref:Major facilitator superfamily (MFS) profile domain-containing protein n=1 Tax=Clytia hemisphaerica TaxID=252671 RepID=A0A7M5U329_9CNID